MILFDKLIYDANKTILREEKNVITTSAMFNYWTEILFEKIIRIFEWTGLPFPQREIEQRLMLNGYCGIVNDAKAGIIAVNGSPTGVTPYSDIFTDFVYAAPTAKGGTKKIGKGCVLALNTSLSTSMLTFLQRYASLFAHCDVTLKCALVNMRYTDTFNAHDDSQKESINSWYNDIYAGKCGVIVSDMLLNETTITQISNTTNQLSLREIIEARNDLMRNFFAEIGIRYAKDKKANMVVDEVTGDSQFLMFNVSDMLKCREETANGLQNVLGIKEAKVRLSQEYELLDDISESEVKNEDTDN